MRFMKSIQLDKLLRYMRMCFWDLCTTKRGEKQNYVCLVSDFGTDGCSRNHIFTPKGSRPKRHGNWRLHLQYKHLDWLPMESFGWTKYRFIKIIRYFRWERWNQKRPRSIECLLCSDCGGNRSSKPSRCNAHVDGLSGIQKPISSTFQEFWFMGEVWTK